jgi:hypothetical protein
MKAEVLPLKSDGRIKSTASKELIFLAIAIPPFGYKSFHVSSLPANQPPYNEKPKIRTTKDNEITNGVRNTAYTH